MIARIRKAMDEKEQGFTLIELLVVMIIIGILAAIAVPVFLNQRTKAVDTSIKSDIKTVATNIETYAIDNQGYPAKAEVTQAAGATVVQAGDATKGGQAVAVTAGNTIAYTLTTDGKGFCLRGSNPKANATGTGTSAYFFYANTAGGLKAAPSDTAPGVCAAF